MDNAAVLYGGALSQLFHHLPIRTLVWFSPLYPRVLPVKDVSRLDISSLTPDSVEIEMHAFCVRKRFSAKNDELDLLFHDGAIVARELNLHVSHEVFLDVVQPLTVFRSRCFNRKMLSLCNEHLTLIDVRIEEESVCVKLEEILNRLGAWMQDLRIRSASQMPDFLHAIPLLSAFHRRFDDTSKVQERRVTLTDVQFENILAFLEGNVELLFEFPVQITVFCIDDTCEADIQRLKHLLRERFVVTSGLLTTIHLYICFDQTGTELGFRKLSPTEQSKINRQ